MNQKELDNVDWVCEKCGDEYGSRIPTLATYHNDTCGICLETKSVTQPRDYGYLTIKNYEQKQKEISLRSVS